MTALNSPIAVCVCDVTILRYWQLIAVSKKSIAVSRISALGDEMRYSDVSGTPVPVR